MWKIFNECVKEKVGKTKQDRVNYRREEFMQNTSKSDVFLKTVKYTVFYLANYWTSGRLWSDVLDHHYDSTD